MIEWLARVHLTRAACYLGEGLLDSALTACERALDLGAPRSYRLIHADALVLRAQIALARNDATTARTTPSPRFRSPSFASTPGQSATPARFSPKLGALSATRGSGRYGGRAADLSKQLLDPIEPVA